MAPGARSKFGAPMFEAEVFRKQIYCIEESTCDNFGMFWLSRQSFGAPAVIRRPHNDSALGKLFPPWPRSLRPWCWRCAKLLCTCWLLCTSCCAHRLSRNFTPTKIQWEFSSLIWLDVNFCWKVTFLKDMYKHCSLRFMYYSRTRLIRHRLIRQFA